LVAETYKYVPNDLQIYPRHILVPVEIQNMYHRHMRGPSFCVQRVKMRGECLFCWYLWNFWPSLFKLCPSL